MNDEEMIISIGTFCVALLQFKYGYTDQLVICFGFDLNYLSNHKFSVESDDRKITVVPDKPIEIFQIFMLPEVVTSDLSFAKGQ